MLAMLGFPKNPVIQRDFAAVVNYQQLQGARLVIDAENPIKWISKPSTTRVLEGTITAHLNAAVQDRIVWACTLTNKLNWGK